MESLLRTIKQLLPKSVFEILQPYYHELLAYVGAVMYGHPSKKIKVIGVTGTKGKSSVTDLLYHLLTAGGHKVALSNTIHFIYGEDEEPNLHKMTMPGRFFLQKFLRKAVDAGCEYAVVEMTSEGAKQGRHKHIELDAFIFTNLSPEHIESHGSFENYRDAKLKIRDALTKSPKQQKVVISNKDDAHGELFADSPGAEKLLYSLKQAEPYATTSRGILFTIDGVSISSPLIGLFNVYNALAAITYARHVGVPLETIKAKLESVDLIKGRVQFVRLPEDHELASRQKFSVVVDYAHTADSLEKLYGAFPDVRKICVLGKCGGGRDKWSRAEMATIADQYCDKIILTNEDPYDDDPEEILRDMKEAITEHKPELILDRRNAIFKGIKSAKAKDVVLITGKGTDPYIMGPGGSKTPWSDAKVAEEELAKALTPSQRKKTTV